MNNRGKRIYLRDFAQAALVMPFGDCPSIGTVETDEKSWGYGCLSDGVYGIVVCLEGRSGLR